MDLLPYTATAIETDVKVVGGIPTHYPVPTDVAHMRQRHLSYSIDSSVKTLTFINPLAGDYDPAAKIQAILNINGQWQPKAVDWTAEDRVSLCLDKPEERVTQVILVITNSNYTDRSHVIDAGPGDLVASPSGCKGWVGSASAELTYHDTIFTITVDNLRFAPDEEDPGNERYDFFELVETSNATWHVSGTWFETCTPSGTMSLLQPGGGPGSISGYFHVDKLNNTYSALVTGNTHEDTLIINCPNSDPWSRSWPISSVLDGGVEWRELPADGYIDEEYTEIRPVNGGTWRWNLHQVE